MGDSDSFFNHLEAFLKNEIPNKDFSTILQKLRDNDVCSLNLLKVELADGKEAFKTEYNCTSGIYNALTLFIGEQGKV